MGTGSSVRSKSGDGPLDDNILDLVMAPINLKHKNTKVICTMGPSCWEVPMLLDLMQRGLDVARFNFSHGDFESHYACLQRVRKVRSYETPFPSLTYSLFTHSLTHSSVRPSVRPSIRALLKVANSQHGRSALLSVYHLSTRAFILPYFLRSVYHPSTMSQRYVSPPFFF